MKKLFTDLSYNNKTLNPVGHPIDDLHALYKKKDSDYNYVIDNTNKIETALNNVPHLKKDEQLLLNAKNKFKDTFDSFGDALEDKIVDTKKLANDITNNYGLKEVQNAFNSRTGYVKGLKERYDKGEITKTQMNNAIAYSDKNYEGVSKDDRTGLFGGGYSGRSVGDYIDVSGKVMEVLKGFKANTIPLKLNGKELVPDPSGSGYYIAGTRESVTEGDLVQAAKDYLKSNDLIQEQFKEDIFYELDANNNNVTKETLQRALAQGNVSKSILKQLGINSKSDLNTLEERLQKEGLDLNDAYSIIRKDQLTNEAIATGVEKESYVKYGRKYLKPIDFGNGSGSGVKNIKEKGLVAITKVADTQQVSPTDYSNIKQGKEVSKQELVNNTNELKKLQDLAKKRPGEVSEGAIKDLKRKIAKSNYEIDNYERQQESIKNHILSKSKANGVGIKDYYGTYVRNMQNNLNKKVGDFVKKHSVTGLVTTDALFGGSDKEILSEAQIREKAFEKFKKDFQPVSYEDFENEAIFKYSQKDTNNALGALWNANSATNTDSATRFVATQLKNRLGNLEDMKILSPVKVFTDSTLSNSANTPIKNYRNIMNQRLKISPENFNMGGKNLNVLLKEKVDDLEDIDRDKMSVNIGTAYTNGQPTYVVSVPFKKEKGEEDKPDLQITVNYEGDDNEATLQKIVLDEARILEQKKRNGTLLDHDINQYKNFGETYINTTPAGKRLDFLNLRTSEIDKPLEWQIAPGVAVNITPKISESKDRFGSQVFELSQGIGDNKIVFGTGKDGKRGFYSKENLQEPDTFQNAAELKKVIGARLLDQQIGNMNNQEILNSTKPITTNTIIKHESSGNPNAVSRVGATGLMQIMPSTSKGGSPLLDYNKANNTSFTDNDLKNPNVNKKIGEWYFNSRIPSMLRNNSLPDKSAYRLIAYNWGIGKLKEWHENGADFSALPLETQNYLTKFLKN